MGSPERGGGGAEGHGKAYSRIVLSFCAEWFNTIVTESNAQAQLGFILIPVGLN